MVRSPEKTVYSLGEASYSLPTSVDNVKHSNEKDLVRLG
jgi:hypothetical protein